MSSDEINAMDTKKWHSKHKTDAFAWNCIVNKFRYNFNPLFIKKLN